LGGQLKMAAEDHTDYISSFLIAEFQRIKDKEINNNSVAEIRLNLYFAVTYSAITGVIILKEILDKSSLFDVTMFCKISLLASLFVFIFGELTFLSLLYRWYLSVVYLRKLARIRKWFLEKYEYSSAVLVYSANENKPSYIPPLYVTGTSLMVMLTNMIAFGLLSTFLLCLLGVQINNFIVGLIVIFVIMLAFIHIYVVIYKIKRLENMKYSAFPPEEVLMVGIRETVMRSENLRNKRGQ